MARKTGTKTGTRKTRTGTSEGSQRTWFKSGESGNPHGRPRREVQQAAFGEMLQVVTPERWKSIVEKWTERAERGDLRAIEALANRLLGAVSTPEQDELNDATKDLLREFFTAVTGRKSGDLARGEVSTESADATGA